MRREHQPVFRRILSRCEGDTGPGILSPDEPGILSTDDAKLRRELVRAERIWAERMKKCQRH